MSGRTIALWLAVAYSAAHFVYSGIISPLQSPNLRQMANEMRPVAAHIDGASVAIDNPRQYGPTFFFVLDPILRATGRNPARLSHVLYVLEFAALAGAWWLTLRSLSVWFGKAFPAAPRHAFAPIGVAVTLLWLNFSPLLYVLGVKGVEGWELCLIAGALYALLRGRRWISGACIAAATLTKMLPGLFLLYFAIRDRRALAWAAVFIAAMLSAAHVIYGPAIGWQYPALMLRASHGRTWALTYHENVSVKGVVVKAFGHLQTPTPDHVQVADPDPETGYWVAIDDDRLALANAIGQAAQAALLVALVWMLLRRVDRGSDPSSRAMWEWSLVAVMMLLVSPQTAFEYMLLALGAFSFVLAVVVSQPRLLRRPVLAGSMLVALVLVGNIMPRQLLNRIVPVAALIAWSGYRHLTLSEAYQYFGFPLFGMLALLVAVSSMRDEVSPAC